MRILSLRPYIAPAHSNDCLRLLNELMCNQISVLQEKLLSLHDL